MMDGEVDRLTWTSPCARAFNSLPDVPLGSGEVDKPDGGARLAVEFDAADVCVGLVVAVGVCRVVGEDRNGESPPPPVSGSLRGEKSAGAGSISNAEPPKAALDSIKG